MKLIIYLPAFNEAKRIESTLNSLPKKLNGISEIQYLVIDDGSTDNTVKLSQKSGAKVFSHRINKGVGSAFHSGVEQSLKMGADIMVSIDADGQFEVKDIPALIEPILKKEADFTSGNRFHIEGDRPQFMSKIKYWGNYKIAKLISRIAQKEIRDVACGFRAYNREALLNLNLIGKFTYTQESILDLVYKGFVLKEIPISVKYFKNRTSRVANNIFRYAINSFLIIFRSYRDYCPLKFFGTIGITLFIIGLSLDGFVFVHYLSTETFSPYKAVGFLGLFFNNIGIIVCVLALLADMFSRIQLTQEKILYFEKKRHYEKNK